MNGDLLTASELAEVLGISVNQIRVALQRGAPHIRVPASHGGRPCYLSTVEAIRQWRENRVRLVRAHDCETTRADAERRRSDELWRAAIHGEWPNEVTGAPSERSGRHIYRRHQA